MEYRSAAKGQRGQWATSEIHGTWLNPTGPDGTPMIANRRELTPQIRHFRVFNFAPLVFAFAPFPNARRLGGFETPGSGRWVGYRSVAKDILAQWTTAETNGTWRNPPEPDGTPRNTQRGNFALKPAYFWLFSHFRSDRFPISPSLPAIPMDSMVSQRLVLHGGWGIGGERPSGAMRRRGTWRTPTEPVEMRIPANGQPRKLAGPHGT